MSQDLFRLIMLSLLTIGSDGSDRIVLKDPFVIHANDTISSLYDLIKTKISSAEAGRGISIIFQEKVILNAPNDQRTITQIGMDAEFQDIQIIEKPVCAALLEMVFDINNKENIPWFECATECLSDPSANHCKNVILGKGLDFDGDKKLIGVDLSHLELTGTIHLESLPQNVLSLDLSFNDLNKFKLSALNGKSVEKLNVKHNDRCHVNTECFATESGHISGIKELKLSSNQIFPWIVDPKDKMDRIRNWLSCQHALERVMVDGVSIYRGSRKKPLDLHTQMLRFVEGVTNKEVIPWYHLFVNAWTIQRSQWKNFRVKYTRSGFKRKQMPKLEGSSPRYCTSRYHFDLSGLGLEGHIDLGLLPNNVYGLDLSNNNLDSISFVGRGAYNLRELNIQQNDKLRIELSDIETTSKDRCLAKLRYFSICANQLRVNWVLNGAQIHKQQAVRFWLEKTTIKQMIVDDVVFVNANYAMHQLI